MRSVALALVLAAAGAGAWPACGSPDGAAGTKNAEVDPGPTFGVEVTVAIKGRGRVVSEPTALDCPSSCFARILLADPKIDGSDLGLALRAEPTIGSHFVGWTYESMDLGVRARGPAQCSPMKRSTLVLPAATGTTRLALHYGETAGTPPTGLEAECAGFTTVPVAYALTATFEENRLGPPGPTPVGPPIEVLFEPPALGNLVGREIGLMGGRVYWRFDRNNGSGVNLSGIASGQADGKGGGSIVNVPPSDFITKLVVGRHLVFQQSSGLISVLSSSGVRAQLSHYSPCASLASDDANAYCRLQYLGSSVTYLYAWPIGGGNGAYLYTLPRGSDLAVDEERFYFSDDLGGTQPGQAVVESAPRPPDGGSGIPSVTKLVFGQTSPRDLVLGPEYLFWLDDQGGDSRNATTALKSGATGLSRPVSGVQFIAVDPSFPSSFWMGIVRSDRPGDSSIVRASALSPSFTSFRSGLSGLGGIAVSDTHVYWTQSDGRVYRAAKD